MRFIILCAFLLVVGRPAAQPVPILQRYTFTQIKMGSPFHLLIYAPDSLLAARAARAAFDRIDTLNRIFSDYLTDSEINRLAKAEPVGAFHPVSSELWQILRFSRKVSRASRGAFDVTIGPLTQLWRGAFRRQEFPELEKIEKARDLVNFRKLKLHRRKPLAALQRQGMGLDLGGVAKGYAVDEAYRILREHGLPSALVDGGGDIYAGQAPPTGQGWRIQRQDMEDGVLADRVVLLENEGIATSGDTYRFLEWEGKRYSHLIDPRTGLGRTDRRLVSVRAGSCVEADALASAASIMEVKKIARLAGKFKAWIGVILLEEARSVTFGMLPEREKE